MDTTMQAKSSADREMNEAMMHMTRTMDSTKMTGDADRDFMVMMIPHHQAAIDMAKIELRNGKRPLVKTLAHNIIDAQAREIKLMHSWLRQWYGNASG
ncbi:MAG: DUF305 domain-containing protein [Candidatus Eremiobacteraeota bacterium]|nr:DUF305 domain-containing protein [Candidatus Eremiobacteraeota bacterium]MBC5828178.1 DUF305 domain-containing protein [Candidatus Eremiobacteraeota bacterium]